MNTRRTKQCALAGCSLHCKLYLKLASSLSLRSICTRCYLPYDARSALKRFSRLLYQHMASLVGWIHVASFTWRLLQVPLSFFDKDLPDLPCVTRILVYSTSHLIHIVFCGLQFNSKIIFHFIADMMDKSTSLYVLSHIGDQFCSVMQEERKAITQAGENGNKTSQSLSGTRCIVIL